MKTIITEPKDDLGRWLCHRTGGNYSGEGQYIGLVNNGVLVAVVGYEDYNGKSIRMHVAAEGKSWLNKEFLWYAFHYPFNELKVTKILGLVDSTNEAALRFDKHLGMIEEAVIKDAAPHGNLHILTMTRDQCRFLK